MASSQRYCKKAAFCATCNKLDYAAGNLQQCSACKQVWYCSKECQKKDWGTHKSACATRQAAHGNTALNKTNPVLHMARFVTQNEEILRLIEFILIASLNLASGDLNLAKTHSVYFMTTVCPIPGHLPDSSGKQRMGLKILFVQNKRGINSRLVEIGEAGAKEMVKRGMPQSEVDKTVSANFVWQPWPDSMTVNYNWRLITPEKVKAFKEFKLPKEIRGVGPPIFVNATTPYIEYLNGKFLQEYKSIATMRVDTADHKAGLDILRKKAQGKLL
ncbi:hypothetical protein BT96DRAFT_629563 [Gymnopus androsaceus JB14]|uniref:MYND-type domain-containing protein n=1 Tax=Gymnopus androsaceus JB14 TaxID=1447944 RepID=A0A6A4IKH6_9AGAR|nr:hypothetical protein BT96DRAFT_629563 [Gymnopus androsaceus JB14]